MEKEINIEGKLVKFKATGATPIFYSQLFPGEDFLVSLQTLVKHAGKDGDIPPNVLETFAKVALVMARQADPSQPDNIIDFLDQFEMFSIYDILPQILELWNLNTKGRSTRKKDSGQ